MGPRLDTSRWRVTLALLPLDYNVARVEKTPRTARYESNEGGWERERDALAVDCFQKPSVPPRFARVNKGALASTSAERCITLVV